MEGQINSYLFFVVSVVCVMLLYDPLVNIDGR